MDGCLDVFGSEQDGGEWDDSRLGLTWYEESGVNVGGPIIRRQ